MRVAGELAGGVELRLVRDGLASISYWTFPQFRRRGLATRAARLVADWAFSQFDLELIELAAEEDNLGSRGVARGAGFVETGRRNEDGLLTYERRR